MNRPDRQASHRSEWLRAVGRPEKSWKGRPGRRGRCPGSKPRHDLPCYNLENQLAGIEKNKSGKNVAVFRRPQQLSRMYFVGDSGVRKRRARSRDTDVTEHWQV